MSKLLEILKAAGLQILLQPLEELGVETPDDLQLLEDDAIQELQFNYVQKKKLKTLIEKLKSSDPQANKNLFKDMVATEDREVNHFLFMAYFLQIIILSTF